MICLMDINLYIRFVLIINFQVILFILGVKKSWEINKKKKKDIII